MSPITVRIELPTRVPRCEQEIRRAIAREVPFPCQVEFQMVTGGQWKVASVSVPQTLLVPELSLHPKSETGGWFGFFSTIVLRSLEAGMVS